MKKFTVIALLAALVAGAAFADAQPTTKTAAGAVVSYAAADTAKAAPAVIVVKVDGKDQTFVVDAKTTVEGKDKKAVDVATVKAGTKVVVTYAAADKVLDAVSVVLQ
jgi:hypothetical protein